MGVTEQDWSHSPPVEPMGEPFRVWQHPPGLVWQAVRCADHKLRPMQVPQPTPRQRAAARQQQRVAPAAAATRKRRKRRRR